MSENREKWYEKCFEGDWWVNNVNEYVYGYVGKNYKFGEREDEGWIESELYRERRVIEWWEV